MHVAVDAVGVKQGGGVVVLNGILRALESDPRVGRVTIFCSPFETFDARREEGIGLIWRQMDWEDRSYAARMAWLNRGLTHVVDRLGADVVLCLNGVGSTRVPRVNYVQQSLYFSEAVNLLSVAQRAKYRVLTAMAERSCRTADRVLVQTDTLRKEMALRWEIDARVATPTPPTIRSSQTVKPQVLWVGNDLGYKRKSDVETAEEILRDERIDFLYAVSGSDSWEREKVAIEMRRSLALVMSSVAESYPMPMVEAMAWSCPVISVDAPYARDLCDDAAVYYEAGNANQIATWIRELSYDEPLRESLIARGHTRVEKLRGRSGDQVVVDTLCEVAR